MSHCFRSKVQVLYGGNEIFDHEVDATFWNDVRLAFFTLIFIVIFMFILTSFSLWLTCWGILSIVLSFPLALFLYREVFGVVSLGILNGAAAFLIIGIGKLFSDLILHLLLNILLCCLIIQVNHNATFSFNSQHTLPCYCRTWFFWYSRIRICPSQIFYRLFF